MSEIIQQLEQDWESPFVLRGQAGEASRGAVSPKFLANSDSQGTGPSGRFKFARKVAYPKAQFFQWLKAQVK
jgi:hypothetical protein